MTELKIVLITLSSIIAFALIAAIIYKSFAYTPTIPNGIAEFRTYRIGGIDQTVLIRTENPRNPILLYLHSGPGTTELIPFRRFHTNLEKHFTVVQWEQRGTGKSFSPSIPVSSMHIDQFVADAEELTLALLRDFGQTKVVVAAHSWGTVPGILLAQKRPDLIYAYIATGQITEQAQAEKLAYEYLLKVYASNDVAMNELKTIGSLQPYLTIDQEGKWFDKIVAQRKLLVAGGGEFSKLRDYSVFFSPATLLEPEYSLQDYIRFAQGSSFSLKSVWPEIMRLNISERVKKLDVPFFVLQGKSDYVTSTKLAKSFFESLKASNKTLVEFEFSGHHPMYEEPEKYESVLIDQVLPLTGYTN